MSFDNTIYLGWPISSLRNGRSLVYGQKSREKVASDKGGLTRAISYNGGGHLITFAPTLLTYKGATIVIDPKGENFNVTARRRLELGSKVYVLDPFSIVTPTQISAQVYGSEERFAFSSASLNPLDFLIRSSGVSDDAEAQTIAVSLAERSGSNALWDNLATLLLTGMIQFVATSPDVPDSKRSMSTVVKLIFRDNLDDYIADITKHKRIDRFSRRAFEGFINSGGEKMRGEVISFARSYLTSLTTQSIQNSIASTTIDLDGLIKGEPITIYIVFPPSKLRAYSKLLRMWVTALMQAIMSRTSRPELNTLFLLDECAQLGELEQLRTAVTLLRGYGLQAWMFFQDLSQIEERYADWRNLINNCAVVQAFGLSRQMAAEPIANLIGGIDSQELVGLGGSQQLLAEAGKGTRIAELMTYWRDPVFKGLSDTNPLLRPSEIRQSL